MTRLDGGVPLNGDLYGLIGARGLTPSLRWNLDYVGDADLVYPAEPITKAMQTLFPQTADFKTRHRYVLPEALRLVHKTYGRGYRLGPLLPPIQRATVLATMKKPVRFFVEFAANLKEPVPNHAVYVDHNTAGVQNFVADHYIGKPAPRFDMTISVLDTWGEIKKTSAQINRAIVRSVYEAGERGRVIDISGLKIEITPAFRLTHDEDIKNPQLTGLEEFERMVALFDGLARYGIYYIIPAN